MRAVLATMALDWGAAALISVLADGSVDGVGLGAVMEAAVLESSGVSASSKSSIVATRKQFTLCRGFERKVAGSVNTNSDAECGLENARGGVGEITSSLKETKKAMLRSCMNVEDGFLVYAGFATDKVKDGGVEKNVRRREKGGNGVAKQVSNRELGDVRGHLKLELTGVISYSELSKEREWIATGACRAKIVAAEERVTVDLDLEAQSYEWVDGFPLGVISWGWKDCRIISADKNNVLGGEHVTESQDCEVVVGVVVVGARLAGESHASQGSELSFNIGLQVDVKINKLAWNAQLQHLLALKDDRLTMLALVESRVIIGEGDLCL